MDKKSKLSISAKKKNIYSTMYKNIFSSLLNNIIHYVNLITFLKKYLLTMKNVTIKLIFYSTKYITYHIKQYLYFF